MTTVAPGEVPGKSPLGGNLRAINWGVPRAGKCSKSKISSPQKSRVFRERKDYTFLPFFKYTRFWGARILKIMEVTRPGEGHFYNPEVSLLEPFSRFPARRLGATFKPPLYRINKPSSRLYDAFLNVGNWCSKTP